MLSVPETILSLLTQKKNIARTDAEIELMEAQKTKALTEAHHSEVMSDKESYDLKKAEERGQPTKGGGHVVETIAGIKDYIGAQWEKNLKKAGMVKDEATGSWHFPKKKAKSPGHVTGAGLPVVRKVLKK